VTADRHARTMLPIPDRARPRLTTYDAEVPAAGAEGVIIAQGGRFGGWAVYAKDGHLKFLYNLLGIHEFATTASAPIPAGRHQVRMEFAYDGGGLAKGGAVTLRYDGEPVGTGRVEATQPMIFSADETTDIGHESGTTTTTSTPRSGSGSRWPGSSRAAQTAMLTGKVAIQASVPTKTTQPDRVSTQRSRGFLIRVLMPAKKRTTA
jgi:hypothetical protein